MAGLLDRIAIDGGLLAKAPPPSRGGLLGDSWDDPRTAGVFQLAQGLLRSPNAMQGLTGGLLDYQQAMAQGKKAKSEEEDRKMRQQLQALQLQQGQQGLAQQQAQATRQQQIEQAYRGAIVSPQQQALSSGGGPTAANAQAMQGLQPSIDQAALLRSLTQVDPMAAYQMMQPKPADYKVVGGSLVQVGPDGVKEAYRTPEKPDLNSLVMMGPDGKPMLNQTLLDAKRQIARAGASSTSVSYGSPVAGVDAKGNPVFIQPSKDGSAPHVVPGMRPPKSALEERAEQEKITKERTAQQMVSALNDAEEILKGGRATASGVGSVADAGARVFGITTKGAPDAARLEALSGWLVANVPRMEGPQSNFDVQNYMTMAGKVGDRTTPIPERLAAMNEVRRLQHKYSSINAGSGGALPQAETKPAGGVIDFGSLK